MLDGPRFSIRTLSNKPVLGFALRSHTKHAFQDGQADRQQRQGNAEEQQNGVRRDGRKPSAHPGDHLRDSAGDSTEDITHNVSFHFTPSQRI